MKNFEDFIKSTNDKLKRTQLRTIKTSARKYQRELEQKLNINFDNPYSYKDLDYEVLYNRIKVNKESQADVIREELGKIGTVKDIWDRDRGAESTVAQYMGVKKINAELQRMRNLAKGSGKSAEKARQYLKDIGDEFFHYSEKDVTLTPVDARSLMADRLSKGVSGFFDIQSDARVRGLITSLTNAGLSDDLLEDIEFKLKSMKSGDVFEMIATKDMFVDIYHYDFSSFQNNIRDLLDTINEYDEDGIELELTDDEWKKEMDHMRRNMRG